MCGLGLRDCTEPRSFGGALARVENRGVGDFLVCLSRRVGGGADGGTGAGLLFLVLVRGGENRGVGPFLTIFAPRGAGAGAFAGGGGPNVRLFATAPCCRAFSRVCAIF